MKRLPLLILLGSVAWAQDTTELRNLESKIANWSSVGVYSSEDAQVPSPKPGENRVVFLGDELTQNWAKLPGGFFPGKPYIDRGIAGQTTGQMLVRFRQDVVALHPRVVVIQAGLNDIGMVVGPGTEGTISENLRSMIDIAKVNGIKVVIVSLTPVCNCYRNELTLRPVGKIAAINGTLRDIVAETGSVFLNFHGAIVDPATRQTKQEFTDDGVWPNAAAYAAFTPLVEKAIADAMAK